jgi:predicted phosphodiesterase
MVLRILIIPDVHLEENTYAYPYELVKKFIKIYKPHETILLGDFMDCMSVSHWNEGRPLLVENKRYCEEIGFANKQLDYLQKYSKMITYLEGNHENWVEQYIERFPQLQGGIEIPLRLELEDRRIEWIPLNQLYKVGHMSFTHGIYTNNFHAKKHLETFGGCICYGHTHRSQSHTWKMAMQEPIMAYGLGCLCSHSPHYLKNKPASWIDQFAIMECDHDTGRFNLLPINITNNQFIYDGVVFK